MLIKAALILVAMALWGAAMLAAFAAGVFTEQMGKPYKASQDQRQRVGVALAAALFLFSCAFIATIAA